VIAPTLAPLQALFLAAPAPLRDVTALGLGAVFGSFLNVLIHR
jgi:hypothetical protein